MAFEIYYGIPGLIGASIVLALLGMSSRYTTATPLKTAFVILSAAAFVYALGDGLARLSAAGHEDAAAGSWNAVRFLGIAVVPAALIHCAGAFSGRPPERWVAVTLVVAYALSAVFGALRLGTTWVVQATHVQDLTIFVTEGPGFQAFAAYGIGCTAVAVALFFRGSRQADTKLARINATKGWVGALMPFSAGVVYFALFHTATSATVDPIVPFLVATVVLYASAVLSQQVPAASLAAIRDIFSSLPDGLVIVNRSGLVTFANAAATATLAKGHPGVEGNEMELVLKNAPLPPEARSRLETAHGEVVSGAKDSNFVAFEISEPKPRAITAVFGAATVGRPAAAGRGLGALSVTDRYLFLVLHDETDARTKELALKRANEVKDLFISMIGHDLKAPLNAITGYSELIALDSQSSPDALAVYRFSQSILGSARQIHLMMENARIFSRLVDPQDILRARESIELGALVEREATNLRAAAERKLIRVVLEGEGAGPASRVFAAPILRSVFQNVIDNAIKYAPEKSTVTVRVRPAGNAVEVDVEDEGPGIPADKREAIFQRFTRLDQTRTKTEGIGLGLAISRQIVELHGGTLTAHDRPGGAKGALFRVRLPRGDSA